MSTPPYMVGIDSGTQSVRVLVFDFLGNLLSQGSARHAPLTTPKSGYVEQDPLDLWDKLCQASRQAMMKLPKNVTNNLAACSLTAQRSTLIVVDKEGKPLRPAINWMDARQVEIKQSHLPTQYLALQKKAKACWIKQFEPSVYQSTEKFLSVSGWLTYQLSGEFKDCKGSVAGIWPFDISHLNWSDDPLLYEAYGTPREKLVELLSPGQIMGRVTHTAAEKSGLPEGLLIIASSGDKMCEMLGAGAIQSCQGYITYGTMAGLEITTPEPIYAKNGVYWTNPSALPDNWCLEFAIERGFIMLDWFLDLFGPRKMNEGKLSLALLDNEANYVPAGSGGIVLVPRWTRFGTEHSARSIMIGLDSTHTRGHLYRSMIEGYAYVLRNGMEIMQNDIHSELSEVMVGGGGAGSDLVMQITADVFGLPVIRVQTIETCALGAAIQAAVGCGAYTNHLEAVKNMTYRSKCFEPNEDNHDLYNAVYSRIYKNINPSLEELFQGYQEIFKQ